MLKQLANLFSRLVTPPDDWFTSDKISVPEPTHEALKCESYEELLAAWKNAMKWTDPLDVALSSMLAVAASTKLQGDQIWLRIIGIAGTAKTTLCEALSTNNEYTFPMSLLTGLHSGYRGDGEDSSLIPKINGKTAIINEGDMLLKAPNRDQIMAELRDLYSGVSRSFYRNGKHATYANIRTTVILAGTPTLRVLNKSALGDRFLDCVIYDKQSDAVERQLVKDILDMSLEQSMTEATEEVETQDTPEKRLACQMTAGYLSYLRANIVPKLQALNESGGIPSRLTDDCEALGLLTAAMRTRPAGGDEDATEKELHVRLSKQLRKMALCLAVVLGRPVDKEVMRRTAEIAKDTSYGITYKVCTSLLKSGPSDVRGISLRTSSPENHIRKAIDILFALQCIKTDLGPTKSGAMGIRKHVYRLTPQMVGLLNKLKQLLGVEKL